MNKLFVSVETDVFVNQAIEYKLFKNESALYLWHNNPCVVIGENQFVFQEVNIDYARKNNIMITRRISGGGSVYHDLNNFNYTVINSIDDDHNEAQLMVNFLKSQNIDCYLSERNDICVDSKKVSGHAYFYDSKKYLHHGTLLFDVDFDILSKVLTLSIQKLESHAVRSVKSRVLNLADKGLKLSYTDFIEKISDFFQLEIIYLDKKYVTVDEINFFKNEERIFKQKIDANFKICTKRSQCFLKLNAEIITEIEIYTDSLKYNFDAKLFIGKSFNYDLILAYLKKIEE